MRTDDETMETNRGAARADVADRIRMMDLRYNRSLRFRKGGEHGEEPIYSPYIQINHTDPSIPGGVFYLSPDLWVESSLGTNLPVEGEANQIYARIHNRGLSDVPNVNVRFYWADPSAAITDQTVIPIGGNAQAATVAGVFIPAAAAPGADSAVVVPCPVPWFPAPITHECLLVKAWSPGFDPTTQPYEPVLDPVNDRHSAQHNVTVKRLAPGQKIQLSVNVANLSGFEMRTRIVVNALSFGAVARRLAVLNVPLEGKLIEPPVGLPVEAWLGEERRFLQQGPDVFGRLLMAEGEKGRADDQSERAAIDRPVIDLHEVFGPWERRQVMVNGWVPDQAQPGEVYGFDIVEYLGGIRTGGYTAIFVVSG